jgi:hypothetical protein
MAHSGAKRLPLRHPAEIPTFVLMVILNFAILAVLIDFLATTALIPPALRGTNWEATIKAVAGAIILVAPAIWRLYQLGLFGPAHTVEQSASVPGNRF